MQAIVSRERLVQAEHLDHGRATTSSSRLRDPGGARQHLRVLRPPTGSRGARAAHGSAIPTCTAAAWRSRTCGWQRAPRASASDGSRSTGRTTSARCWGSRPTRCRWPGCAPATPTSVLCGPAWKPAAGSAAARSRRTSSASGGASTRSRLTHPHRPRCATANRRRPAQPCRRGGGRWRRTFAPATRAPQSASATPPTS